MLLYQTEILKGGSLTDWSMSGQETVSGSAWSWVLALGPVTPLMVMVSSILLPSRTRSKTRLNCDAAAGTGAAAPASGSTGQTWVCWFLICQ